MEEKAQIHRRKIKERFDKRNRKVSMENLIVCVCSFHSSEDSGEQYLHIEDFGR